MELRALTRMIEWKGTGRGYEGLCETWHVLGQTENHCLKADFHRRGSECGPSCDCHIVKFEQLLDAR